MRKQHSKFSLRKNDVYNSRVSKSKQIGTILSEENYRDLVESSGSIIMKTDKDLNITYINDFGLKFFGYSMEELLGKNVVGTTIPKQDDSGRDLAAMAEEIKINPQSYGTNVHQNMCKNGNLVWISWTNKPKYDKKGSLKEILAIGNDISKLVNANKSLKAFEERFKILYENLRDAFVQVDMDGNILEFNEAYHKMLGYTTEELRKLTYKDITPSKWHAFEEKIVEEQIILHGYSDVYEKEYRRKDGTIFPVELRTILVKGLDNKTMGMWAIVRDITKRKQTEMALMESEKKFHDMFEYAPIDIAFIGLDGTILDLNNAAVTMHGFSSREELVGKNCLELVDKEYHKTVTDAFISALQYGHMNNIELVQLSKDKQKINTLASATVMYDTQSKPCSYIAMIMNITEQKRLEKELKKYTETLEERVLIRTEEILAERKRLFDVLETLPTMVCLINTNYMVVFANRSFRQKFGESLGHYCYECCQNKTRNCKFCETYKVLIDGQSHRWENKLPDGTILDINDYPFTDVDGSRLILKMYIDITKQRSDEIRLRNYKNYLERLNEELSRSNQELQNFAYVASHDLQEPLRMITSFTQLLESRYKENFDNTAKEYMGFIVDGGKRMYDLINGLLAYSRISRNKIGFSVVDINNIIEIVKANLATIIKSRNCRIEHLKLHSIEADQNMMIQLFQNLILNGIKFSKETPHITISSKIEKKQCIFSIKDEGIGIEPQYFEKIFRIYARLNPKDEFESTGIGLAICKKIIENHKGTIWVESELGKGSVFYFSLPIKKNVKSNTLLKLKK